MGDLLDAVKMAANADNKEDIIEEFENFVNEERNDVKCDNFKLDFDSLSKRQKDAIQRRLMDDTE